MLHLIKNGLKYVAISLFDYDEDHFKDLRFYAKLIKDKPYLYHTHYVVKGDVCTQSETEQWLKNDCKWVDACLDKNIKVNLNQNQFDALASFVYNIGETAFVKSTMLTLINQNNLTSAASQFDC